MTQTQTPSVDREPKGISEESRTVRGPSATRESQGSEATRSAILTKEDIASESPIWQMGWSHGLAQGETGLDNIGRDSQTQSALAHASQATGVSADNLTAMAIIESSGNRSVGTNVFGYTGLMQMGSAAATDVGMSYGSLVGAENVGNNALAGARYWGINDARMAEDVPRDPLHMYLAHQQGAAGVSDIHETIHRDSETQAHSAMRNNLPEDVLQMVGWDPTYQEYHDYWAGKMAAIQNLIEKQKAQP